MQLLAVTLLALWPSLEYSRSTTWCCSSKTARESSFVPGTGTSDGVTPSTGVLNRSNTSNSRRKNPCAINIRVEVMSTTVTPFFEATAVSGRPLFGRSPMPVIVQVHGFCVGGGTDFALCSDLIVCAEDCRIGYPPARVWGSPTTSMWIYRIGLERDIAIEQRLQVTAGFFEENFVQRLGCGNGRQSRGGDHLGQKF